MTSLWEAVSQYSALQQASGLTDSEWRKAVKFKGTDFGWIIMNVGMAIGAGIVFLPIQVGLDGMWVFIAAALLGYPTLYAFQRLYLNVLAGSDDCDNFSSIVSGYLGANVGLLLGIALFLLSAIAIFLYSTALTNDSASFLVTFHVTETPLSENIFYGLAVICFMVAIASQGEKLLMKISSGMVCTKFLVIVIMGLLMTQYWNIGNLGALPGLSLFIKQVIAMFPLIALSIAFFPALNPVIAYYRRDQGNKAVAHYRAMRVLNYAYFLLLAAVLFYVISFNLSINHAQAVRAYEENISSLALVASSMQGDMVKIFSLILNIFAVMTAYFSIFLAFRDSCMGITLNVLKRVMPAERINRAYIKYGTSLFCIVLSWGVIVLNMPILSLASLLGPLMGFIGCILPVWVVLKIPQFRAYRNWQLVPIAILGTMLVIAPLVALV